MKKHYLVLAIMAALAHSNAGCGNDDDGGEGSSSLEISGDYVDQFMMEQHISAEKWNDDAIVEHDNAENVVYTQWADDNEFTPGLFAKTVYLEPAKDRSFYFCMVVFDAETLDDAKASGATADDSDPETTGCGGEFPWSYATKQ
jgi:hypothetical protein